MDSLFVSCHLQPGNPFCHSNAFFSFSLSFHPTPPPLNHHFYILNPNAFFPFSPMRQRGAGVVTPAPVPLSCAPLPTTCQTAGSSSRVMLLGPGCRPNQRSAAPGLEGGGSTTEVDRISALPDDLLPLIHIECSHDAARTSVLAGRWRDLWTCLPEHFFNFDGVDPETVEATLARVTRPTPDHLGIQAVLDPKSSSGAPSPRDSSMRRGGGGSRR
jgi:hypothetical protein